MSTQNLESQSGSYLLRLHFLSIDVKSTIPILYEFEMLESSFSGFDDYSIFITNTI